MDISLLCKFYQRVIWDVIWVVPSTSTGGLVKNLTQLRSQLLSFWLWYMVASLRTFFVGITWTDFLWWWFVCFIPQKHVFMLYYGVLVYILYLYTFIAIYSTSQHPGHQLFSLNTFLYIRNSRIAVSGLSNMNTWPMVTWTTPWTTFPWALALHGPQDEDVNL